jgi:hypothetical protein
MARYKRGFPGILVPWNIKSLFVGVKPISGDFKTLLNLLYQYRDTHHKPYKDF